MADPSPPKLLEWHETQFLSCSALPAATSALANNSLALTLKAIKLNKVINNLAIRFTLGFLQIYFVV
jgi:hypothetical protein